MPGRICLLGPRQDQFPGIKDWIDEAITLFCDDNPSWEVEHESYDRQNSFGVHRLYVKVLNKPGPIVLLNPVQSRARNLLRAKAMTKVVILDNVQPSCTEDVWAVITEARRLADEGFPMSPRRLVVAVLIIRKLMRQKQWGGKKGYLKRTDLPEGGIPPRLKGLVLPLANDLRLHGVLVHKVGDGRAKYGLNNVNIEAIHTAANGDFSHYPVLKTMLEHDDQLVTAAYLKEDLVIEKCSITLPGGQSQEFPNLHAAIAS
jgi:hypothetical protein